jgi:hypothetical protein
VVTGILVARAMSESDWQRLFDQRGKPCACAGKQLCLAHFGMLDNVSRARARRAAGITGHEDRR